MCVSRTVTRRVIGGRLFRFAVSICALYIVLCLVGGVLLAEMQLHPPRMKLRCQSQFSGIVQHDFHSTLQDVSLTAADGITLRGWYVVPQNDNDGAVILLHGVSDNREGVAGYARLFLQHGYRVLLPDARAHGVSGGELATYGLRESDDIHRWVDWLENEHPQCVYGFGESMGAALLLQSLAHESRFCAVVVESPFAHFRDVAYERAARYTRMPFWVGRTVERPIVDFAFLYVRYKYGFDFGSLNTNEAVAKTATPILLIADERDLDILPHHVVELHQANPQGTQLWTVSGAAHGGAWGANPDEFNRRVLNFFQGSSVRSAKSVVN